jgi:hypothetical protein
LGDGRGIPDHPEFYSCNKITADYDGALACTVDCDWSDFAVTLDFGCVLHEPNVPDEP